MKKKVSNEASQAASLMGKRSVEARIKRWGKPGGRPRKAKEERSEREQCGQFCGNTGCGPTFSLMYKCFACVKIRDGRLHMTKRWRC